MRKLIIIAVLASLAYMHYGKRATHQDTPAALSPAQPAVAASLPHYQCDGRQHCSQMGSYDEALFFLRNCPNTKMDGDGDGIPCERQFGRH